MGKLTINQKNQIQEQKYQKLEALNFFNKGMYYWFYIIFYVIYMIVTIFQVWQYFSLCLPNEITHFHCSYVPASYRVMVVFATLPIQVFLIEGMTKMYGRSLSWFSLVKIMVHEILVISFFETEVMMNETMKIPPNYNIALVVMDIGLLLLIDVPYMPYPMNVFCILTDGLYLSYRFLILGVPWYICFKSMLLVLLCAIYFIQDEKCKFKIQTMINEEIIQLNQFKECLNAMPEGVAIINQNQEVVFSNVALSKIIGQTEEEFNILKLKNADYFKKQSQKIRLKIEQEYLLQKYAADNQKHSTIKEMKESQKNLQSPRKFNRKQFKRHMTFHSPAKKRQSKKQKQVRKFGSILEDHISVDQQNSQQFLRKQSFDFSLESSAFIPEYKKLKQPKSLLEEPFIKYFSKHQRLENLVKSLSQKMKVQEVERSKYLAKQVMYQQNKLEPPTDNNPFLELYGYKKELKKLEEKPEHLRIFKVNIGEQSAYKKELQKNLKETQNYHISMQTFAEKNSQNKLIDLKVAPMLLDNKISMCVQFNDVTKQNIISTVVQKSQLNQYFMSNIINCLNEPLDQISQSIQFLRYNTSASQIERKKAIEEMDASQNLIHCKLKQFKDYAKFNENKLILDFEFVNIEEICFDTLNAIFHQAKRAKINNLILLMDKTVKPMICTDKERFRGILINLLSFIIGNLTTNQIIIQIKYKSPSEICVIFKKTLKSTKDSQSKRDILELKKYIDNKLLTYQINNKLSSLLGKDRTKGLELLVIKDHEEENPNELFHFCLYNQDKQDIVDQIVNQNKQRRGEVWKYQDREYYKTVIDLSEDANIHFLEETFRHPDGSQRPEEIKLQNSSRSFSLTESIRDRGGDKLQENIRESQIEDDLDIKTNNMKGIKRSAKQNELQKQRVFISPFQDTKINQRALYIKQLKEQQKSTARILPSLRKIVNEINNVVLLITDRTSSLGFFQNNLERIGLNYKIQDKIDYLEQDVKSKRENYLLIIINKSFQKVTKAVLVQKLETWYGIKGKIMPPIIMIGDQSPKSVDIHLREKPNFEQLQNAILKALSNNYFT